MNSWIDARLIKEIGNNRYKHSLDVMEVSINLAQRYNYDTEKARVAGLLHDCAKYHDKTYLLKRVDDFGIMLDEIMTYNNELIHGVLGAVVAEKEFNIQDIEILDAIRYHTTGRENMKMLDKIIYLADYIEPGRSFTGLDKVRDLAFIDIDKALILAMENTIKYLLDTNKLIHLDTIKARNYLLREVYRLNE